MDPFSIIVGVSSLLDISLRVAKFLKDVQEGIGVIEAEVTTLLLEIKSLEAVNKSIKHLHETEIEIVPLGCLELPDQDRELWKNTATNLLQCQVTVQKLYNVLQEITGKHGNTVAGWRDGIKKQMRKQAKDGELSQLRIQLSLHRDSLHMSLTMLDMIYTRRGSDNAQRLGFQLLRQIASVEARRHSADNPTLQESLGSATAIASKLRLNKHFDIPKTVSSIFTGRKAHLDGLKQALDRSLSSSDDSTLRKRFVVFGLGGSGKHNFVASLLRTINNVDASSQETAHQSFVSIAKLCGVDPNERAAKSWLSSIDRPWLLLIDNADDTKIEIERYFPDGEQGFILITTRNPSIKMHGTIGQRFYHFEKLDEEEATDLLLRAAEHPSPRTPPILQLATKIARALGSLPLALVHAGNAIKAKYCGLSNYLAYYDRSWQMIRQERRLTKSYMDSESMNDYIEVYSSYEILYRGLEAMEYQRFKDAIQLLQLFSFFHHEQIPFELLIASVRHPRIEREAQQARKSSQISEDSNPDASLRIKEQSISWMEYIRAKVTETLEQLFADRSPIVLPTFLRDAELSPPADDSLIRLRKALNELLCLSLLTYHEVSDSYSVHPLVHMWVRERPQMATRDQAVWCEAAMNTISRCILLPPLSNTVESHADLPRKLLPHLLAVEKCRERIQAEFENNRKMRWRSWPVPKSKISASKALRLARASLVYSQCGYFEEAEVRQRTVMQFVYKMRGPDHPRAMDITLALSGTLWQQSRANEAADLQDQVLSGCLKTLGPNHLRTLKVMDALGESRRQQGRLTESIELHEKAIQGMKKNLPPRDPSLFHALEHLGLTLWYTFRFEDAQRNLERAVAGLKDILGPADLKTLIAMEALAITYIELGAKHLESDEGTGRMYLNMAHRDMSFVVEERTKQLGAEQPYTWLAKCNLGRVVAAMGDLDEGENMIKSLIPMAVDHLGPDHMGVLANKNHLAKIIIKQKRYTEAEEILLDISRPEKYRKTATSTGDHPDRCEALWNLLICYQEQGKIDDALRTSDEITKAIISIRRGRKQTETSSTFWQRLQDKIVELKAMKGNDESCFGSLDAQSSTMELKSGTVKLGVVAVSSDIQVQTAMGDIRRRETR